MIDIFVKKLTKKYENNWIVIWLVITNIGRIVESMAQNLLYSSEHFITHSSDQWMKWWNITAKDMEKFMGISYLFN